MSLEGGYGALQSNTVVTNVVSVWSSVADDVGTWLLV